MFLTTADFVGKYKIAKDCYSKELLEEYIELYEERYLKDLFGCDLYDAFISSLNNDDVPAPQEGRFIKIYEPFCVEDVCDIMYRSDGILEMLKGFIYYEFVLDQKFKNTLIGTVMNEGSFSRQIAAAKTTLENRYNLAVQSYISMQLFMIDSKSNYPEFNGVQKRQSFFGGAF